MNKNPTNYNASENLSRIVKERTELEEKIKLAKETIEQKKKEQQHKIELQNLKKEYDKLTYSDRHPTKHKIKSFFKIFKKEIGELHKKATDYNKTNPWDLK